MDPQPKFRIKSLENRTTAVEAKIEQVSSETETIGTRMDRGFDQAHAFVQERFAEIRSDIAELKSAQTEQGAKLDQILTLLQQKSGG